MNKHGKNVHARTPNHGRKLPQNEWDKLVKESGFTPDPVYCNTWFCYCGNQCHKRKKNNF